jgi:hypothetical protein
VFSFGNSANFPSKAGFLSENSINDSSQEHQRKTNLDEKKSKFYLKELNFYRRHEVSSQSDQKK